MCLRDEAVTHDREGDGSDLGLLLISIVPT